MVKRTLAGIKVPEVASNTELRKFVFEVYDEFSSCYLSTGEALDVSAATVWKLLNDQQDNSPIIREKWGIRKTPPRPRVWMPTNNLRKAMAIFRKHYPEVRRIDYHDRGSNRLGRDKDPTC